MAHERHVSCPMLGSRHPRWRRARRADLRIRTRRSLGEKPQPSISASDYQIEISIQVPIHQDRHGRLTHVKAKQRGICGGNLQDVRSGASAKPGQVLEAAALDDEVWNSVRVPVTRGGRRHLADAVALQSLANECGSLDRSGWNTELLLTSGAEPSDGSHYIAWHCLG